MNSDQSPFESYRDAVFQFLESAGVMMHLDDDEMPDFLDRLRAAHAHGMSANECAESIHAFIRESDEIGAVDTAKDFLHTAKVMENSVFVRSPSRKRVALPAGPALKRGS